MVFNPPIPELATVTSEALQAKIRQLLPSQDGFGTDLVAQNVIVPIVDLTQAAQGSDVPSFLQTAYDSVTGHNTIVNTTTTLITTAGFWKVDATVSFNFPSSGQQTATIQIDDGASTNEIYAVNAQGQGSVSTHALNQENFVVFLRAGDSLTATTNKSDIYLDVVYRQIADINGTLVQPSGFDPQ